MRLIPSSKPRLVLTLCVLLLLVGYTWYIYRENHRLIRNRFIALSRYPYIPPTDRYFDFTVDFYGLNYKGNTGNYQDAIILYTGAWEKAELSFMLNVLKKIDGGLGVYIDVGAGTGHHAMFLAKHGAAQVHAFEPYPPVLRRFQEMVTLNALDNISIHPIGLGNKEENLPYYKPPSGNLMTGSFLPNAREGNEVVSTEEFPIAKGDIVLAKSGLKRADLIKVDIEGFEKYALQGLHETLERYRPVVMMELNSGGSEAGVRSRKELEDLFPQDYNALMFHHDSDPYTGEYDLIPFDFTFVPRQKPINIVVYPIEKRQLVFGD